MWTRPSSGTEHSARYYGSWTDDFTELSLSLLADGIARREDYYGAIAILDLNKEHFPKSSAIYLGLAQMYEEKDDDCGDIVQRQLPPLGSEPVDRLFPP